MTSSDPLTDQSSPKGGLTAIGDGTCPWAVSSHADARSILVSAAAQVPADTPPACPAGDSAIDRLIARGIHLRGLWMWGCDTDRRIPRRKAATAALGPGPVGSLGPYLEARAAALLDGCGADGEFDLVEDFARPLVRDALMELFGIDPARRVSLEAQVGAMVGFVPGNADSGATRYFALAATASLLEDIWAKPLPPLASASKILRSAVETRELTLDEAIAQGTLLLFGNSYTTLDALTGLMARMTEQPRLWQDARDGALPVVGLVEESLRLGPPTHLVLLRDTVEAIECRGSTVPAGTLIVLPLDRLNRDPACFEDPDAFEPSRGGPPHLAFGAGRHMCVGLHLARAVIRIGVEALLRRLAVWPAETRIDRAPGILGGLSVDRLNVPARSLHAC